MKRPLAERRPFGPLFNFSQENSNTKILWLGQNVKTVLNLPTPNVFVGVDYETGKPPISLDMGLPREFITQKEEQIADSVEGFNNSIKDVRVSLNFGGSAAIDDAKKHLSRGRGGRTEGFNIEASTTRVLSKDEAMELAEDVSNIPLLKNPDVVSVGVNP
jgi:hypothetical protein